jgi:SAM-dependent methyltransferase
MPLAYYSVAAERDFWSEHWGTHSVEELLAVARRSPLTALIEAPLPVGRTVLEAGCGLGQYVVLLREHGFAAIGVDWSVEALAACHKVSSAPLAAAELAALPLRDGAVGAYISLGVVEHDERGPDAILAEASRVLARGGVALVSVPYRNAVRRLAEPWLRLRGRAVARRGGRFYQYAFSRRELAAALARHGLAVRRAVPYDPVRVLRHAVPRRWRAAVARTSVDEGAATGARGRRTGWRGVVRRTLYTEPALRAFGHMLLAVAVKR